MTEPTVSVITTVYNGEPYVEEAIDSILRQTFTDFEFVIVDDGSRDDTARLLNEAASRDSRIRVISSGRVGRARALNQAWQSTRGRFIANIDADDYCEPERLEKQVAYLMQHPGTGLLGTARSLFDGEKQYPSRKRPLLANAEIRRGLIRHMQFFHSSIMVPRGVLEDVGGYDERLKVAIDYDLCVRIARRYPVANLPEPLVTKRTSNYTFFMRMNPWRRYRTAVGIRFMAWRAFGGRPLELWHVISPFGTLDDGIRKRLLLLRDRLRSRMAARASERGALTMLPRFTAAGKDGAKDGAGPKDGAGKDGPDPFEAAVSKDGATAKDGSSGQPPDREESPTEPEPEVTQAGWRRW